jgi:hypothetical protein
LLARAFADVIGDDIEAAIAQMARNGKSHLAEPDDANSPNHAGAHAAAPR